MQDNFRLGIYYLSLLYAFVIPLSRAGIVGISVLLILFWILERRWKEKWNELKNCKVFWAISLLILYSLISLLWTDLFLKSLKYISKYWYLFPTFVIFTSFPKERSSEIIKFFLFGMVISEIISYGILFEFWTTKNGTPEDPTPFMDHLDYSIFLAFTSLLLLVKVLYSKYIREKMLYLFFFLTVSGNLFITAGRSGQLAFFITLAILLFLYFRKNIWKSLSVTVAISILAITVPMLLSDTFKNRVLDAESDIEKLFLENNYNSSWGNRIGAWEVAFYIARENPFLGLGNQDNIQELRNITSEKEHLSSLNWYPHFHNQYLDIVTALGFVGLLIFLNIFFQIYKKEDKDREIYLVKIVFISIFLVGFISEPFIHKQFTMALFSLILGYILLTGKKSEKG